ncbi:hypothetical protein, partial [Kribbella aluminosa]
AARHIDTALHLTSTLTATHTALRCGALTFSKALAISEATRTLPPTAAQAVETHVLKRAPGQTHQNLNASLRRQVAKHTTREHTDRHHAATTDRTCKIVPLADGMAGLWIVHTADKIQQMWIVIQAMADLAKRSTPARPSDTRTTPPDNNPTPTNPSTPADAPADDADHTAAPEPEPDQAPRSHADGTSGTLTRRHRNTSTDRSSTPAENTAPSSPPSPTDTHTTSPSTAEGRTDSPTSAEARTGSPTPAEARTDSPTTEGYAGLPTTEQPAAEVLAHEATTHDLHTAAPTDPQTPATADAIDPAGPGPDGPAHPARAGSDKPAHPAGPGPDNPAHPAGPEAGPPGTARPAAGTGPDGRIAPQRRADVVADLFEQILHNGLDWLGRRLPDQHRRRPHIEVLIPITTLLGMDDDTCELAGYGPIPADMARRIATNGTWRRLLTDPTNGAVLEASTTRHDPGTLVTETLLARHPVCAWPGCNRTSRECDRDHITPYARTGETSLAGLAPFCEYHHVIKDTKTWGWTTTHHPDGSLTLTAPTGHRYTTIPPARGPITQQPSSPDPPHDLPPF